jgi:hypothetical protein
LQGVDAAMFKAFCQELLKEAHDLDANLHHAGLL